MTIDVLPEDALLEIFDFYVDETQIEAWQTLVHVCRNWRNLVFGSPRRLNLRLNCTARTPVGKMLDIWPPLPIVIKVKMSGVDNIFTLAALEHKDRITELELFDIPPSLDHEVFEAIRHPFPVLTCLQLWPRYETRPVFPSWFLGGSAPRLQTLILHSISFPEFPTLLLSATSLVRLHLWNILPTLVSSYVSPEEMVTGLSALTSLDELVIEFGYIGDQKRVHLHPSTRTLLPALTKLRLKWTNGYLENLVARIDAPLLDNLEITFFRQLEFDTPQLNQFISRTPKFKTQYETRLVFSDKDISVTVPQTSDGALNLQLGILGTWPYWGVLSLAQVCSSSFPQALIPAVERLYILENGVWDTDNNWRLYSDSSDWLELLHPFTAVKDLYVSSEFTSCITFVLQELVGERVTEVLPALQTLFLAKPLPLASGPLQEIIEQFVAARQIAGHPIAISRWEGKVGDR